MTASDGHIPKPTQQIIHATSVAVNGCAALLTGAAGSGKSTLGLQLVALGAGLICDDRTRILREHGQIMASAAPNIAGLIEARGVGILRADAAPAAPVALVVDLDRPEIDRLPEAHVVSILGVDLPCLHKIEGPHFPAAILQYLKHGLAE
ncbi:HPr kinase/phosphorylase [Tropicimonas sp. S265A]|uniref:HPr kinase/phosphorylase n=1 Tax=Tropicimonas sp. S265A TaxID=3415134 RepID=UPI003C7D7C5E